MFSCADKISQVILMMQELIMHLGNDLQALVKGVVVISDNGGVDANIMKQMTPSLAKKMVTIFQV